MIQFKNKIVCTFFLAFFAMTAFSQNFLNDGSLKLNEISTNKKYGYESDYDNSIKVGNPDNILNYLRALKGPNGEKVFATRIGSCCAYEIKDIPNGTGLLAKWQVPYEGLKEPITLYLNKNVYDNPKCPIGFTFKKSDEISTTIKFPKDSIITVTACASKIYSVDNFLLQEKLGTELLKPDQNPTFKGGLEELKKYFVANPLTDEKAKQMIFRVSISFLISCDGKAGNFEIISKGRGDLETYANQILAIVNRMPQAWLSAMKDSKAVDCYQVLSFTASGGQLDKVSFK